MVFALNNKNKDARVRVEYDRDCARLVGRRILRLSYARRSAGWGDRIARTHTIATAAIDSNAQNTRTEISHSGKTT